MPQRPLLLTHAAKPAHPFPMRKVLHPCPCLAPLLALKHPTSAPVKADAHCSSFTSCRDGDTAQCPNLPVCTPGPVLHSMHTLSGSSSLHLAVTFSLAQCQRLHLHTTCFGQCVPRLHAVDLTASTHLPEVGLAQGWAVSFGAEPAPWCFLTNPLWSTCRLSAQHGSLGPCA